jgi:hypothetical protein
MLDRVGHGDALDRSGIRAQRLDFDLETRMWIRTIVSASAMLSVVMSLSFRPRSGGH